MPQLNCTKESSELNQIESRCRLHQMDKCMDCQTLNDITTGQHTLLLQQEQIYRMCLEFGDQLSQLEKSFEELQKRTEAILLIIEQRFLPCRTERILIDRISLSLASPPQQAESCPEANNALGHERMSIQSLCK